MPLSLGFCSVVLVYCLFGDIDLLVFILINLMDGKFGYGVSVVHPKRLF